MADKTYKISEVFYSPQGEGRYTGQLTAWVRSFLCNLQCDGFGQKDPTDPSTYILPYQTFDVKSVQRIEDLPVFDYGCDSSYSWSARFKNLCPALTANEIGDSILDKLPSSSFHQPQANNYIHLAFTGGEPLLPKAQEMMLGVMARLTARGEFPRNVTVETNGTQSLSQELLDKIDYYNCALSGSSEFFLSISPKLFHVSGEDRVKAINEEAIKTFRYIPGQLKFVVNEDDRCWNEMKEVIEIYRDNGVHMPVYIMPVGATAESQGTDHVKRIAKRAMDNGYNIAARVHTYLFGNVIGT